ncbi:hypothetical protein BDF19DRAFT_445031 [Syncephalis fuscata]|nr:hypothetical protein BDF19DRAFT_445031 [Syncephalis fuscata]
MLPISITSNEEYSETWAHNATLIWNIQMHPLGERSIVEFITEPIGDIELTRARSLGFHIQLAAFILAAWIFVFVFNISVKLIRTRVHALPGWCCLISSALGISLGVVYGLAIYVPAMNCRILGWYFIFVKNLSCFCHSTIILHKVYLALRQQRWILVSGILINLIHLGIVGILLTTSVITIEPFYGCVIYYIDAGPLLCVTTTTPATVFFLCVFSYIAYRQYSKFGLFAWKRLARDGIQAVLLVLFANILCNVLLYFKIGKTFADALFFVDWILTLTILTNYCVDVRNAADSLSSPIGSETTEVDIKQTVTSGYSRFTSRARLTSYFNLH